MRKEKLFFLVLLISISTLIYAQDFEGFETGDFSAYEWQLSGDANWLVTTSNSYEGTYCAQGGDINDNGVTTLEITREVTDNGTISFYWKVGSEGNWDYLRFYLDGTEIQEISGTVGWTQVTTNVTSGSHTFKWEYTKDGSVTTEPDTGWIDNIIFPPSVTYDNDLAGMSVSGNQSVNVGSTESYEILVKNVGINSQNEYTVKLFKSGVVELASLDVTDTIAPDQIVAHDLSWIIPANEPTGPITIYGQVILAGDENSNNDLTSELNIMIYPEGVSIIVEEDFSGTFPPDGWILIGGSNWTQATSNNAGGVAPEADFNWSPSTTATQRLATLPVNTVGASELILEFKHNINDYNGDYELRLETSSDGVNWNTVQVFPSVTIPATTENIVFTTPDVGSATFQLAWTFDGYSFNINHWYIDDVLLEGTLITYDNDLAGQVISGNTIVNAGNTEAYSIEVKNVGNNSQNNYVVKLFKEGGEEIASLNVNQTIAPGVTISHDLIWDIPANEPSGIIHLYGQVVLAGDENPNNDSTNNLEIQIFPQGVMQITVGDGTETNTRTPISFQYKNSLAETIYFADELAGAQGMITALTYYNNFTNNLINKPTALWLGETTQTNLTDGWIPSTSLTEVFNGTVTYPSGTNSVTIELTTPYYYNGDNLVVMAFRPMDTQNYGTTDYFMHDTTLEHEDRTRYERDNTIVLDPANPPELSYSGEFFANTTFTFFLGAMGEVEGYVLDEDDNPLEGATVTIEETQTVTYTDDEGYYHFGNVITGVYNLTAYMMGYSPQTISDEVFEDEITQVDFSLIPLGTVAVSGHVVGSDNPDVGLENAVVEITGFENYLTTTDENGDFIIEDVYTNITYDILITFEGYDNYIDEISVGGSALDLGTLTLGEIAYPPGNVLAVQNPEGTEVALSWSPPGQGGGEFRYDDGEIDFLLGYNSTPTNAVFGAVHSNIAVVQEIHWFLSSDYGTHAQVKLYLFGLDEDGLPNTDVVLYESGLVDNIDDEWNIHYITIPVEAYEGFFVGVSTPNEYTSIGMDDGVGEPWEFQTGTQFCKEDWTTPGIWTDVLTFGPNYERNLMIRAYGINMGNTLAERVDIPDVKDINKNKNLENRSFESYNVYRFFDYQHSNPGSWDLIAEDVLDTAYVDLDWINLGNDTYQFAIRSVYTNGVQSIPAFSALIEKTSASAEDLPQLVTKLIANYPNPFNPETIISFSIAVTSSFVTLDIFNIKGQKVKHLVTDQLSSGQHSISWNGTDQNKKPVSSGIYFYRLNVSGKTIGTKRMLLLK